LIHNYTMWASANSYRRRDNHFIIITNDMADSQYMHTQCVFIYLFTI